MTDIPEGKCVVTCEGDISQHRAPHCQHNLARRDGHNGAPKCPVADLSEGMMNSPEGKREKSRPDELCQAAKGWLPAVVWRLRRVLGYLRSRKGLTGRRGRQQSRRRGTGLLDHNAHGISRSASPRPGRVARTCGR